MWSLSWFVPTYKQTSLKYGHFFHNTHNICPIAERVGQRPSWYCVICNTVSWYTAFYTNTHLYYIFILLEFCILNLVIFINMTIRLFGINSPTVLFRECRRVSRVTNAAYISTLSVPVCHIAYMNYGTTYSVCQLHSCISIVYITRYVRVHICCCLVILQMICKIYSTSTSLCLW